MYRTEVLKDKWWNLGGKRSSAMTDICLMKWKVSAKCEKRNVNGSKSLAETKRRHSCALSQVCGLNSLMKVMDPLLRMPNTSVCLSICLRSPVFCLGSVAFQHILPFFSPLSSTSCFVRTLVNLCNPAPSNSCSHWGLSILPQGRSGDHFLWLVFVWMISRTHASFCIFELGSWRVT